MHNYYDYSEYALNSKFDIHPSTVPKTKYVVLSTPRSGSTLVCSALHNSGLAGAPFEYFHHSLLDKAGHPEKFPHRLDLYFNKLHTTRTTPNGVFGMKFHFVQYERVFETDPRGFEFLLNFDKFILTYRRDKILQAISMILAIESNVWSRNHTADIGTVGREFNPDDFDNISKHVKDMVQHERAWRTICSQLGIQPLEIAYEDLETDYKPEFDRISTHLDVPGLSSHNLKPRTIKTTNTALTHKMKQSYVESINRNRSINQM